MLVHWFNAEKQINAGKQMNLGCWVFECQSHNSDLCWEACEGVKRELGIVYYLTGKMGSISYWGWAN